MIWPLPLVPAAALLSFLISKGFFYREVRLTLHRDIGELEMGPCWMGICFPRMHAARIQLAIFPLNLIIMYTWRFYLWLLHRPTEFIWVEYANMNKKYQEIRQKEHASRRMLQMYQRSGPDVGKDAHEVPLGVQTNESLITYIRWLEKHKNSMDKICEQALLYECLYKYPDKSKSIEEREEQKNRARFSLRVSLWQGGWMDEEPKIVDVMQSNEVESKF